MDSGCHISLWWTVKTGFIFLCVLAGLCVLVWVAGVVIGAWWEARQERSARRRRNHRVGSVLEWGAFLGIYYLVLGGAVIAWGLYELWRLW
jgi:CDP-diglyceride synthetase